MARVLRGLHRPVVALRAVQLAQEQVVLRAALRVAAKYVVRRIEPVIDEGLASVPARVIPREENGMGIGLRPGLQVAVDGLYEWKSRDAVFERKVGVENVGVARNVGRETRGVAEFPWGDLHDFCRWDASPGRRQQRDAMPQRREAVEERHDDALGAAVTLRRQRLMGGDDDVHGLNKITASRGPRTHQRHGKASMESLASDPCATGRSRSCSSRIKDLG